MGGDIGLNKGGILGAAGGLLGGGIGGALSFGALGQVMGNGQGSDASGMVNPVSPMVAQLQKNQLDQANNFNANIGNYEQGQINAATDASRLKTQQAQNESTARSNARGMLYGGYNQNKNNQISAEGAGSLNKDIANINLAAQNQGQQLNNQAINSGLVMQDLNQNVANQRYNAALAQQQANSQGINGLIGGVAGLAGLG